MLLRSIPHDMASQKVAQIDTLLDGAAKKHDVFIPWAIESGSRAWGFPSPDSDYDCRFIYVRSVERHLTPWSVRDVIELPIRDDLDVNGWDLAKALGLLLKGNAVVVEWLMSPIVYQGEADFRDTFLELAARVANRDAIAKHYLHLGQRQRRNYLVDRTTVPQKKLFYALRPAAALRWLWNHPAEKVAPMNFQVLLSECDPPRSFLSEVTDLLEQKKESRELGEAPISPTIQRFIDTEFQRWLDLDLYAQKSPDDGARATVAAFYRDTVLRLSSAAASQLSHSPN